MQEPDRLSHSAPGDAPHTCVSEATLPTPDPALGDRGEERESSKPAAEPGARRSMQSLAPGTWSEPPPYLLLSYLSLSIQVLDTKIKTRLMSEIPTNDLAWFPDDEEYAAAARFRGVSSFSVPIEKDPELSFPSPQSSYRKINRSLPFQ